MNNANVQLEGGTRR